MSNYLCMQQSQKDSQSPIFRRQIINARACLKVNLLLYVRVEVGNQRRKTKKSRIEIPHTKPQTVHTLQIIR